MQVKRHTNLTNALKSILSLCKTPTNQDARVYVDNRLVYATYEDGQTTLLALRSDERKLFGKMLHLMLK